MTSPRLLLVAMLCSAFVLACGGSSRPASSPGAALFGSGSAATPASPQAPAAPDGSGQAPLPSATGPLPQVKLQRFFGAGFRNSTGMYQAPDGRWLLLQRAGTILLLDNAADAKPTTFLDITKDIVSDDQEEGLLGLAFAPDYAQSGVFYLDYTVPNPLHTVIARYRASADKRTADASTREVLLQVNQPFPNHKGGQMVFGPDGFLYIGFGDGGSGRDPMGNGQNRNVLLGKILRLDVSGTSPGRAYRVPADNPFVGQANTRDEIFAYGLRNPWRFSFDATGRLWVGDVGQSAREEVDLVTKGGNYGWSVMEGNDCLSDTGACDKSGKILPLLTYPTTAENCAIVGGFVYRGAAIPQLRGAYVYGDYCSGHVWALRYEANKVTEQTKIGDVGGTMSSFAQDASGELYAIGYGDNAGVFKLEPK